MDAAYTAVHLEEDRAHWWFRARLTVLRSALQIVVRRPARLLEIGCGSGNVLGPLREFGEAVGMEPNAALRSAARDAGLDVRDGSLPDDVVVEPGWADVVLLLDVLEHVDDEDGALACARTALHAGGLLVVTVPAYEWLWSGHDVMLGHRRRYTARTLRTVVGRSGFTVARVTYFNTLLFPAIALARILGRLRGASGHDLRRPAPAVNRALERIFAFERHLIRVADLPFGCSVLLLARR